MSPYLAMGLHTTIGSIQNNTFMKIPVFCSASPYSLADFGDVLRKHASSTLNVEE
jgi:hypothetical protein